MPSPLLSTGPLRMSEILDPPLFQVRRHLARSVHVLIDEGLEHVLIRTLLPIDRTFERSDQRLHPGVSVTTTRLRHLSHDDAPGTLLCNQIRMAIESYQTLYHQRLEEQYRKQSGDRDFSDKIDIA